jgi:hypothetical protein
MLDPVVNANIPSDAPLDDLEMFSKIARATHAKDEQRNEKPEDDFLP